MIPALEPDGERTAGIVVRYAWYLSAVPIVSTLTSVTSTMFALEGIALNAYALTVAHRFQRERTNANARKVFLTSLWYLPSLLMLFLLHSKTWDEEDQRDDVLAQFVADQIHWMRHKGKEMCLHEVASQPAGGEQACPVAIARRVTNRAVAQASATVAGGASEKVMPEA